VAPAQLPQLGDIRRDPPRLGRMHAGRGLNYGVFVLAVSSKKNNGHSVHNRAANDGKNEKELQERCPRLSAIRPA